MTTSGPTPAVCSSPPLGVSVAELLRQPARRTPGQTAIVERGAAGRREYSFAQLDLGARRVAGALRGAGVAAGGRVALSAANSAEFVSSWFGVLYAGCAVVPVPVVSAPPELALRIAHAGCTAVLVDAARTGLAEAAIGALSAAGDHRAVPVLDTATAAGDLGAAPADLGAELALPGPVAAQPSDTAMVLYTSGTTGQPKGAAIPHASLFAHTAVLVQHALRLTPEDRVLGVLPMTHSYGCRMLMLAAFYAGARTVLMPRFDAADSLAVMAQERVSWVPGVPTMFAAWGNLDAGKPPPRLRWAMCAGAGLPAGIAQRAEGRLGAEIREGFGMTEATICTLNAPPDSRELGSVGRPVWGIDVRVVGDDGADVPTGHRGEVIVRGHNMMSGYLDDAGASAEALREGYMHTGDVGRLDAQGRLYIVDRVKDMIIRGGNNVYPSEVEAALSGHADIAEVAVVGRPDDYYGEEVVAVAVLRQGAALDAAGLFAYARTQVARTKLPREVAFLPALPLGPSGKVLKRTLRDRLVSGELTTEKVG